ncbi:MAG: tRNA (5-methylaminomethyl-2-thiouridine)(34)-methyltransferase MnmD [Pseudomonadota bacterium]
MLHEVGRDVSEDHPILDWQGDVPVARAFDDPYFSMGNGLEETQHVFLAGNGLPERFVPGFRVAELGFGTGLNILAVWQAWRQAGVAGPLRVTSFERYPMAPADMERALRAYPELSRLAEPFLAGLNPEGFRDDTLRLDLVIGDARDTLPRWAGQADAWFLDGFSPAKNPELWEAPLLAEVGRQTRPGGTAATYSAAGSVRRGLAEAGFCVERVPGYARKRHMTVARRG